MLSRRIAVIFAALIVFIGSAASPARANEAPGEGAHSTPGADHKKPPLLANPFGTDADGREARLHSMWVLIIFIVLLAILYPTAWKNILAGLKAREAKIRGDIAAAEEARRDAEKTLAEYKKQLDTAEAKMRQIIADGTTAAERVATDIKMKAQKEAEETKQRSLREIEMAGKQAMSQIYAQAAELSTSIASKIIRRNLNASDQQDLVRGSLEQLQKAG